MGLLNRSVAFKIRDIYIPEPREVLSLLYGDDLLEGVVVDLSDNGTRDGSFVVVAVKRLTDPVVVPAKCVRET